MICEPQPERKGKREKKRYLSVWPQIPNLWAQTNTKPASMRARSRPCMEQ